MKQRKALLLQTELYKARQRRREMLQYLAQPVAQQQSAVDVQQALYDIAYRSRVRSTVEASGGEGGGTLVAAGD